MVGIFDQLLLGSCTWFCFWDISALPPTERIIISFFSLLYLGNGTQPTHSCIMGDAPSHIHTHCVLARRHCSTTRMSFLYQANTVQFLLPSNIPQSTQSLFPIQRGIGEGRQPHTKRRLGNYYLGDEGGSAHKQYHTTFCN
ncbi:hypothetical protein BU24DRAFT_271647 [Aaosphaeria arxii CBS 175.79]|uniref:Uncharacterized protein n=1 Tax=Aaosphaeria arxii CBS 175.79 TaxID=1450172 RepID=A0A6A5XG89_9PLEO|nr:uncharacterized protein BU24DRAFT_271647 [Aaosphaeria arxii CBS 175.79]KAF2012188.1 hypothetical protein BU24DRAFT_271647 [Aaosphaeria arxii CBS 175.79]